VEAQTQLQRDLARAAAEPMLWVDIRGDDATGQALVLLLGNAATSLAGSVKVTFDPCPQSTEDIKPTDRIGDVRQFERRDLANAALDFVDDRAS
jgi:hypothetical protein